MPSRMNRPIDLLSAAIGRSPWSTWISTLPWLSSAVVNVCDLDVGMVVFRSMREGHDPAQRLQAQRQRGDVQQQNVPHVARQHRRLQRRADGHGLVGVHGAGRVLPEQRLHLLDYRRHAGHAAPPGSRRPPWFAATLGVLQRLPARPLHPLEGARRQAAPSLARGQRPHQVLRPRVVRRDEGQVDLRLRDR